MDEKPNNIPPLPAPLPAPVLEYRPPRDGACGTRVSDVIIAAIAIGLGGVMLVIAGAITLGFLRGKFDVPTGPCVVILLLLLAGIAASARCAWFYIGGWSQAAYGGRLIRKTLLPWRWRE